jgi:hypothetical protein
MFAEKVPKRDKMKIIDDTSVNDGIVLYHKSSSESIVL